MFPRFKLSRGMKTGWERKPRDEKGKIIYQPAGNDHKGTRKTRQDSNPSAEVHTIKVEETGQTTKVKENAL